MTATALVGPLALPSTESGNCRVGLKFYQEMRVGLPQLQSVHITARNYQLLTKHIIMGKELC